MPSMSMSVTMEDVRAGQGGPQIGVCDKDLVEAGADGAVFQGTERPGHGGGGRESTQCDQRRDEATEVASKTQCKWLDSPGGSGEEEDDSESKEAPCTMPAPSGKREPGLYLFEDVVKVEADQNGSPELEGVWEAGGDRILARNDVRWHGRRATSPAARRAVYPARRSRIPEGLFGRFSGLVAYYNLIRTKFVEKSGYYQDFIKIRILWLPPHPTRNRSTSHPLPCSPIPGRFSRPIHT